MQTGTQLYAPDGYEILARNRIYHLLRSDAVRERVLLLEFVCYTPNRQRRSAESEQSKTSSEIVSHRFFKPVIHVLSRYCFEQGLEQGAILQCEQQADLPLWFEGTTVDELRAFQTPAAGQKISHGERIDRILTHIGPLVSNLAGVFDADTPDAIINAHARACDPVQNETRLRRAFYTYVCFGFSRWSLHYPVHKIGRWDRMAIERKLGRPSKINGASHGYSSNNTEMIEKIIQGYRRFAGPGQHLIKIYRSTIRHIFGCVVQKSARGVKYFIHPAGMPFPTFDQFCYRIQQAFPLEIRQTYKYGHTRVRTKLVHSKGRFAEKFGNLMEATEHDAYQCSQVAKGYREGSHLPALYVVRVRCSTSGMIVGIGFSIGGETASAYRMALFCAAISKVKFCSLFGIEICEEDWPSIGVSLYTIHDRGVGCTATGGALDSQWQSVIKELAPSYAGQSKASIETSHPKSVKLEGAPHYRETNLSIPQLAVQEILRTIADNNSFEVSDRFNNVAIADQILPSPVSYWNYLGMRGRNHAICMHFDDAVRAYLTPIELSVRDDAIYFHNARFDSEALQESALLQKAHENGVYKIKGYMLDVCVRHLWVDLGDSLIEIDAMLSVRDGSEQLYISVAELEQLAQIRRDSIQEMRSHAVAARSEYEAIFEQHTGKAFEQETYKKGRNRRAKADSKKDRKEVIPYLRAAGGRRG